MKKILFVLILLTICVNFFFSSNYFKFKLMSTGEDDKDLMKARGMKITGAILIGVGGALDIAGTVFAVWHQLDPINAPGSIYLGSYGSYFVRTDFYLNYLVLSLGLSGIVCLAVGIPLLIVGAVKEYKVKKSMKENTTVLNKYTPQFDFNFATKELILGLTIKI